MQHVLLYVAVAKKGGSGEILENEMKNRFKKVKNKKLTDFII